MATEVVDELVVRVSFKSDRSEMDRTSTATDRLEKRTRELDKTTRTLNAQITATKDRLNEFNKLKKEVGKNKFFEERLRETKQELADLAVKARKAKEELRDLREEERRVAKARLEHTRTMSQIQRESDRRMTDIRNKAEREDRAREARADRAAHQTGLRMEQRARQQAATIKQMRARAAARIERGNEARRASSLSGIVADRARGYFSNEAFLDRGMAGAGAVAGGIRNVATGAVTYGGTALIGGTIGLGAAAANVGSRRETMKAGLETAVGNVKAGAEFDRLREFAKQTPYDLDQVVNGFVKLENMGLKSGERAMRSYGDTAGAMGKSLSDMVEAVADATTGEFERLKEFGVKAHVEGDKVRFLFRGVETTIKNDSESIENYLIKLGETNFAGGMDKQAKTLGGVFSNLKDTLDDFLAGIFDGGLGDALKTIATDLTAAAGSGEDLANSIGATLGDALLDAYEWIKSVVGSADEFKASVENLIESIKTAAGVLYEIAKVLYDIGKTILDVGGTEGAVIALGLAFSALLGPIGLAATAGASIGYIIGSAIAEATGEVTNLQNELDLAASKALETRLKVQAEMIRAMTKERNELVKSNAKTAAENEKKKRMIDAGFSDKAMEAEVRKAGMKARRKYEGRTLTAEQAENAKLEIQHAMTSAKLSYMDRAEAAGEEPKAKSKTKHKKGKKHKPDSKYEADVEAQIKEMSEKAGEREGLRAMAQGKSYAEQKAAAKAAQDKVKADLHARVDRGEALPGEVRRGMLKVAGMDDAAGRSTPPPIAIVNVKVDAPQVNVNFTGPVQADQRQMSAVVRQVAREELAKEMQAGISEVAVPAVW